MDKERFCAMIAETFQRLGWMDYKTGTGEEIYKQVNHYFFLPKERREMINNYPALVPFLNGIYDRNTQTMLPHDPKFLFTAIINVELEDEADCPQFRQFLDQILPDKNDQMRILCYLDYCMGPSIKYKLMQIWVGNSGDNGKSELANLLLYMMPEFTSTIPLSTLMNDRKNRFVMSEMAFAWVNLGSEINPNCMTAEGVEILKQITGEMQLRAEKKHETGFQFKPKNKIVLVCNEVPLPKVYCDDAFWKRLQLIEFTETIPVEEQEYNIMGRIFNAEGGQIARMLLSTHEYADKWLCKDANRAEHLWNRNTQSCFVFYNLYCEQGQMLCDELYDHYLQYCEKRHRRKETLTTFTRLLKSMGVQKERIWNEDERVQEWFYTCEYIPNRDCAHLNSDGSLNVDYILEKEKN